MLVQLFLWFTFFVSLSLIFLDSILLIGVFRLIFSLCVCYLVRAFFSSWFRVIAVIVYVGGLLVIFSYFLAVCPNQSLDSKLWILPFTGGLSLVIGYFRTIFYSPDTGGGLTELEFLYKTDDGILLIFLVLILLFALLAVVSVVRLSQGPLRPFDR